MFAYRFNTHLRNFISWFTDLFAPATDAFQIPWCNLKGYSFPPLSMICLCLAKIRKDKATIVMIKPTRHTQARYSVLLEMSCRQPVLLLPLKDLLMLPNQQPHPLVLQGTLQLAVRIVQAKRHFQRVSEQTARLFRSH